jgi:hypothetical protein
MATVIDPSVTAAPPIPADSGDTSLVILQSLLCILREKNVLNRADIEELTARIRTRAADHDHDPLPCCVAGVTKAAEEMAEIDRYIGHRYGGKHRRPY